MLSKRDQFLQQLGVTQWVLKNPSVLKGKISLELPERVHFIIVGDPLPTYDNPLVKDVLRTLGFKLSQVYFLMPFQIKVLPQNTHCHSWRLGIKAPLFLTGVQLYSPNWADFYQNEKAKRALWQQICDHGTDF